MPFVGVPSGPDSYAFSIPAADVLLYETATVNGGPENGYRNARDPVTGTIDFGTGSIQMHVVVATKIHMDVFGDFDGDLTADLSGTIKLPDADGDGVANASDNCPLVANADQSPVVSPLVRAPSAVTLNSCADTAIGRPITVDACFGGPLTVSNDAPHPYPLGSTVVTWSAEDGHSNVETDTQTVTIVDTTPPVFTFVPPNIAMNNCGPANLGLADGDGRLRRLSDLHEQRSPVFLRRPDGRDLDRHRHLRQPRDRDADGHGDRHRAAGRLVRAVWSPDGTLPRPPRHDDGSSRCPRATPAAHRRSESAATS